MAKALGPKYVKLASESLWQIRVLLYVRAKLRDHITGVATSSVATGQAQPAATHPCYQSQPACTLWAAPHHASFCRQLDQCMSLAPFDERLTNLHNTLIRVLSRSPVPDCDDISD